MPGKNRSLKQMLSTAEASSPEVKPQNINATSAPSRSEKSASQTLAEPTGAFTKPRVPGVSPLLAAARTQQQKDIQELPILPPAAAIDAAVSDQTRDSMNKQSNTTNANFAEQIKNAVNAKGLNSHKNTNQKRNRFSVLEDGACVDKADSAMKDAGNGKQQRKRERSADRDGEQQTVRGDSESTTATTDKNNKKKEKKKLKKEKAAADAAAAAAAAAATVASSSRQSADTTDDSQSASLALQLSADRGRTHTTPRDIATLSLWALLSLEHPQCPMAPRWALLQQKRMLSCVVVVVLEGLGYQELLKTTPVQQVTTTGPEGSGTATTTTEQSVVVRQTPRWLGQIRRAGAMFAPMVVSATPGCVASEFFFRPRGRQPGNMKPRGSGIGAAINAYRKQQSSPTPPPTTDGSPTSVDGGDKDAKNDPSAPTPNESAAAKDGGGDEKKDKDAATAPGTNEQQQQHHHETQQYTESVLAPLRLSRAALAEHGYTLTNPNYTNFSSIELPPIEMIDDADDVDVVDSHQQDKDAADETTSKQNSKRQITNTGGDEEEGEQEAEGEEGNAWSSLRPGLTHTMEDLLHWQRRDIRYRVKEPSSILKASSVNGDRLQRRRVILSHENRAAVAIDCEMVVTSDGESSLARLSVIECNAERKWWERASMAAEAASDVKDAAREELGLTGDDSELPEAVVKSVVRAHRSTLYGDVRVLLDTLVKPALPVQDYVTTYSGITQAMLDPCDVTLEDAQVALTALLRNYRDVVIRPTDENFKEEAVDDKNGVAAAAKTGAQEDEAAAATALSLDICSLIGHSLENDLQALKINAPEERVIDTSAVYPHHNGLPTRNALRYLTFRYLNQREIQKGAGGHDSVEDAVACMDLVAEKLRKGPDFGCPAKVNILRWMLNMQDTNNNNTSSSPTATVSSSSSPTTAKNTTTSTITPPAVSLVADANILMKVVCGAANAVKCNNQPCEERGRRVASVLTNFKNEHLTSSSFSSGGKNDDDEIDGSDASTAKTCSLLDDEHENKQFIWCHMPVDTAAYYAEEEQKQKRQQEKKVEEEEKNNKNATENDDDSAAVQLKDDVQPNEKEEADDNAEKNADVDAEQEEEEEEKEPLPVQLDRTFEGIYNAAPAQTLFLIMTCETLTPQHAHQPNTKHPMGAGRGAGTAATSRNGGIFTLIKKDDATLPTSQ